MTRLLVDYCAEHGWLKMHDGFRNEPGPTEGYCPLGDHTCAVIWVIEDPQQDE